MNKKIVKVREDIRKAEDRLREDEETLKALREKQRQLENEEIIAQIRSMQEKGGDIMETLRMVRQMQGAATPMITKKEEEIEHDA